MAEDTNSDARGYSKLPRRSKQRQNNLRKMDGFTDSRVVSGNILPPVDHFFFTQFTCTVGGVAFSYTYVSFIMAMDFFKVRYPGHPVVFDMTLVYVLVALLTVMANNLLVETFSINKRILFGYCISMITLTFVLVGEIQYLSSNTVCYTAHLALVALVSVGCTVQQSSYYGYVSMLPPKYTQAVMVGESTSGVSASIFRAFTKSLVHESKKSASCFFMVSITMLVLCLITHYYSTKSDFVQFYVSLCERDKTKITLEPTEDAGLIETNDAQYGILKIQTSPPPTDTQLSFANPAYEPSAPVPTYKVEDVVVRGRLSLNSNSLGISAIKMGIQARWEVIKCTYEYMISICLVYFATLCIYPGIISEIVSCNLGSWMPLLTLALFNFFDLVGKVFVRTASFRFWTGSRMVKFSLMRLVLVPLMILCVFPRYAPKFSAEITAIIFVVLMGLSNGFLGSAPMIEAPRKVEDKYRELTGNIMTFMYMFGLAAGSLLAYLIQKLLSSMDEHPCTPPLITFKTTPMTLINTTAGTNSSTTLKTLLLSTFLPSTTVSTFIDAANNSETSIATPWEN